MSSSCTESQTLPLIEIRLVIKSWLSPDWRIRLAGGLAILGAIAGVGDRAIAQIVTDTTLGSEKSQVRSTGPGASQIDGGATRGANLFHSFSQFSVPTNGTAFFNNAVKIQNIISRVTGGSVSNIDGMLKANGTANLFLINPNGIIFGPNARLNIGGSFVGSTASSLNFADGTKFSATESQTTPLLTISVPIGLQFGPTAGGISVQGPGAVRRDSDQLLLNREAGLTVQPESTLALVGGSVALSGGILTTDGGRIELGSAAGPSLVSLKPTTKGWALSYESVPTFGNIQLSGAAAVDASGAGGGDIQVQGSRVRLTDGAKIETSTLGSEAGGTLAVRGSDSVELSGTSSTGSQFVSSLLVRVRSGATGPGGNLTIKTGRLSLTGGAEISTSTVGIGNTGSLTVNASDVELSGTTVDGKFPSGLFNSADPGAKGAAGSLTIATGKLMVSNGAVVATTTFGPGNGGNLSVSASDSVQVMGKDSTLFARTFFGGGAGGDLTIATGKLIVSDGAVIANDTLSQGKGGNIFVNASDSVQVMGKNSVLSADTVGLGAGGGVAGNLTFATGKLIVSDGGRVSSNTYNQGGKGGNLFVNASDYVQVMGNDSALSAKSASPGAAGELTIATGKLIVRDGGQVLTYASDQGPAGNIFVNASDYVQVMGNGSGLFAQSLGVPKTAGNITIGTGKLMVSDGAQIKVDSYTFGQGQAGKLSVNASDSVQVMGSGSGLFAETTGAGAGGNLTIDTGNLIVGDGGQVGTNNYGQGQGGNIFVNASDSVQVMGKNSILSTQTFKGGAAGNLAIATGKLIASDGAELLTSTSGQGQAGNLTLTTGKLIASDGAELLTSTFGQGKGGNLYINASDSVELSGTEPYISTNRTNLSAETYGAGAAGDLTIETGRLTVRDAADVSVGSSGVGSGAAGKLEVRANTIRLDNQGKLIATTDSGQGGNITLLPQDLLLLRHNSLISTTAGNNQNGGNGGNITIDPPFIVAVPSENSDIRANAFKGLGGNVQITAQGVFGIQRREQDTPQSDITASGGQPSLNGVININTPNVDLSRRIVALPVVPVDVTGLIAQGCPAEAGPRASKFVVTGRGGMPPSPSETLSTDAVLTNWATLNPRAKNRSGATHSTNPTRSAPTQIVEATGWVIGPKGEVILTAQAPTVTPDIPWLKPPGCGMRNKDQ